MVSAVTALESVSKQQVWQSIGRVGRIRVHVAVSRCKLDGNPHSLELWSHPGGRSA